MKTFLSIVVLLACLPVVAAYETVRFDAFDGIDITADVYWADKDDPQTPFIVLLHQAGYSRGEYREIAPKLVAMGYNCMAVDLRSGSGVRTVINETAREAVEARQSPTYLDAITDILDAIYYARDHYARGDLILWGSSYSASLALKMAADRPRLVQGVIAFSPGEYFNHLGKPNNWIAESSRTLEMPVFIASAHHEERLWGHIYQGIYSEDRVAYIPERGGVHGSRALWAESPDHEGYWQAVTAFLKRYFPVGESGEEAASPSK
ncbi:alpha/beta fold hydrolase [Ruficoccus sp. ZRK36]|uniref:alpha/beta hydrolase n=1 Tax=Ruficoccus sp. ZRK36 TaxID=2866311 RepID=UPI001C72C28F|nr:alpha/beta fold hydrolase [Ruficoccus sp. ZRK36]QYY36125.1 alpha/beta hydrolase [Ruficoccus sp. ZRK36]